MTDQPDLAGLIPERLRPSSAKIELNSLEVMADIGFHDFEVGVPQRLLVTVEVWLEVLVPEHDDPARAWDYDFLRSQVIELAAARRYNLQETFVLAVYSRVAAMRGVKALRVTTSKPDIYADALGVGVELASFSGATPA
jgi:dihydroneopterin aldolase